MINFLSFKFSQNSFSNIHGQKKYQLNNSLAINDESGYLQAKWQLTDTEFTMETDCHGITQLFYYCKNGVFIASRHLSLLTKKLPQTEIDFDALSIFLKMGTYIGNDTFLKDVKVLGPHGRLHIKEGKVSITEQLLWATNTSVLSEEKLKNEYNKLFHFSIEKIKDNNCRKIALPLSGGRDSRHIFLELIKQQIPINQLISSYFEPDNQYGEDVELATMLSKKADIPLQVVKNDLDWLHRDSKKNIKIGFGSLLHTWYLPVADSIEKNSLLIDGLGGDVLSESKKYLHKINQAFKERDWDTLCHHYIGDSYQNKRIFKKEFRHLFDHTITKEKLIVELKKYVQYERPQSAFEFYNRTRRNISLSSQYLVDSNYIYYPFLDKKLFEFLSSVSFEQFPNNNFHSSVISRFYPKYANIPYELPYSSPNKPPYSSMTSFFYREKKCIELIKLLTQNDNEIILNKPFIVSRLLKGLVWPFSKTLSCEWIGSQLSYLSSINKFISR